jgi:hypothetical protein
MRKLYKDKGIIAIEMTMDEFRKMSALFDVIFAGDEEPNWWGSDIGEGPNLLDEEITLALAREWISLLK